MIPLGRKIRIYYDGRCGLYSRIVRSVLGSHRADIFSCTDAHQAELPPEIPKRAVLSDMYAVDFRGRIFHGPDALRVVGDQFPLTRPLVRMSRMPLFNLVYLALFHVVTSNRSWMFGMQTA